MGDDSFLSQEAVYLASLASQGAYPCILEQRWMIECMGNLLRALGRKGGQVSIQPLTATTKKSPREALRERIHQSPGTCHLPIELRPLEAKTPPNYYMEHRDTLSCGVAVGPKGTGETGRQGWKERTIRAGS